MTDIPGRLKDMDKLGVDKQVVFPTLFLIYITDDGALDVAMARVTIDFSPKRARNRTGA